MHRVQSMILLQIKNSKYRKVGVLSIWIVKSDVSSAGLSSESCFSKHLEFTFYIGSQGRTHLYAKYANAY